MVQVLMLAQFGFGLEAQGVLPARPPDVLPQHDALRVMSEPSSH